MFARRSQNASHTGPHFAEVLKMKRYRIANKLRFTLFMTACLIVLVGVVGSMFGYFDAQGAHDPEYVDVTVSDGDTLWELAKAYGPSNTDTRRIVFEICRYNDVSSSTLRAGQIIAIPTVL